MGPDAMQVMQSCASKCESLLAEACSVLALLTAPSSDSESPPPSTNTTINSDSYAKGEVVTYIGINAAVPKEARIQEVHQDDDTPYYTVRLLDTGTEKQTDSAHLRKISVSALPVTVTVSATGSSPYDAGLSLWSCVSRTKDVPRAESKSLPPRSDSARDSDSDRKSLPPRSDSDSDHTFFDYAEFIGQCLCDMQTAAHDAGGRVMSILFGAVVKVRTDASRPPWAA